MAGRFVVGLGETALRVEGLWTGGAGDAVSRLSVDDLFMDEYGFFCARRLPFGSGASPPAFCICLAAAAGFGEAAAAYAVNGFLNMLFAFCGACLGVDWALFCRDMLTPPFCVNGLGFRLQGW